MKICCRCQGFRQSTARTGMEAAESQLMGPVAEGFRVEVNWRVGKLDLTPSLKNLATVAEKSILYTLSGAANLKS